MGIFKAFIPAAWWGRPELWPSLSREGHLCILPSAAQGCWRKVLTEVKVLERNKFINQRISWGGLGREVKGRDQACQVEGTYPLNQKLSETCFLGLASFLKQDFVAGKRKIIESKWTKRWINSWRKLVFGECEEPQTLCSLSQYVLSQDSLRMWKMDPKWIPHFWY